MYTGSASDSVYFATAPRWRRPILFGKDVRPGHRRAFVISLALALCTALVAMPAAAQATTGPKITVETRNLYLGADLVPALLAPDNPALFQAAGDVWRQNLE